MRKCMSHAARESGDCSGGGLILIQFQKPGFECIGKDPAFRHGLERRGIDARCAEFGKNSFGLLCCGRAFAMEQEKFFINAPVAVGDGKSAEARHVCWRFWRRRGRIPELRRRCFQEAQICGSSLYGLGSMDASHGIRRQFSGVVDELFAQGFRGWRGRSCHGVRDGLAGIEEVTHRFTAADRVVGEFLVPHAQGDDFRQVVERIDDMPDSDKRTPDACADPFIEDTKPAHEAAGFLCLVFGCVCHGENPLFPAPTILT